jgi:O-antigen ligase
MTTVLSTISLGMFTVGYYRAVEFGDLIYDIGWNEYKRRLFGLYSNTGYMITSIALAIIVIQIVVLKARGKKIAGWYKAFLIYTAIVNLLSAALENAKGAFISLAVFVLVFTFFAVAKCLKDKSKKDGKNILMALIASVCAVAILIGAIYVLRPALSFVPSAYKSAFVDNSDNSDDEKINSIEIDRDIPDHYGFLTGRVIIWEFGMEEFAKKPIFGHGPQSHREYKVVDIGLRHFHNIIVQSFVSVGIVGTIFVFGFFITVFAFMLKGLLRAYRQNDKYFYVILAILSIIAMFLINSMAEVTILYLPRISMFLFWIFMGYANVFIGGENKTFGTALLSKIDEFLSKILNRNKLDKNEK